MSRKMLRTTKISMFRFFMGFPNDSEPAEAGFQFLGR